jgi:hypothetical protein
VNKIIILISALMLAVNSSADMLTYGVCTIVSESNNRTARDGTQLTPQIYSHLISPLPSRLQKKIDDETLTPVEIELIEARESDFIYEVSKNPINGKILDYSYELDGAKHSNLQYAPNPSFTGQDRVDITLKGISQPQLSMRLIYHIHVLGGSQRASWHKVVSDQTNGHVERFTKFYEKLCGKGHSSYWRMPPT